MRKGLRIALCVSAGFLALTLTVLFYLVFAVEVQSEKDWDAYFKSRSIPEASEELRATFDWQDYEKYDAPWQVWDLTEADWVYEKGEPKVILLQWRVEGDVPLYQQSGCLLTDSQGNLYLTESPYHINDIGWRTRDLYPLSPQIQAVLQKAISENEI